MENTNEKKTSINEKPSLAEIEKQFRGEAELRNQDFRIEGYSPSKHLFNISNLIEIPLKMDKKEADKYIQQVSDTLSFLEEYAAQMAEEANQLNLFIEQPQEASSQAKNRLVTIAEMIKQRILDGYQVLATDLPDTAQFTSVTTAAIIHTAFSQKLQSLPQRQAAQQLCQLAEYQQAQALFNIQQAELRKLNEAIGISKTIYQLGQICQNKQINNNEKAEQLFQLILTIDHIINPLTHYRYLIKQGLHSFIEKKYADFLSSFQSTIKLITRIAFYQKETGGDEITLLLAQLTTELIDAENIELNEQQLAVIKLLFAGIMELGNERAYIYTTILSSFINAYCIQKLRTQLAKEELKELDVAAYKKFFDQMVKEIEAKIETLFTTKGINSLKWQAMANATPNTVNIRITEKLAEGNIARQISLKLPDIADFLQKKLKTELDKYLQSKSKNREESHKFISGLIEHAFENNQLAPIKLIETLAGIRAYLIALDEQLNDLSQTDKNRGQKFTRVLIAQLAIMLKIRAEKDFLEERLVKNFTTASVKSRMATKQEQTELAKEICERMEKIIAAALPVYLDHHHADLEQARLFLLALLKKEYELTNNEVKHQAKLHAGFNIVLLFLSVRRTESYLDLLNEIGKGITVSDSKGYSERSTVLAKQCAILRTYIAFEHDYTALNSENIKSEETFSLLESLIASLLKQKSSVYLRNKNSLVQRDVFLTSIKLIKQLELAEYPSQSIKQLNQNLLLSFFNSLEQGYPNWVCGIISRQITAFLVSQAPKNTENTTSESSQNVWLHALRFNYHVMEYLRENPLIELNDVKVFPTSAIPITILDGKSVKKYSQQVTVAKKPPAESCIIIDLVNLQANINFLATIAETGLPIVLLTAANESQITETTAKPKANKLEHELFSAQVESLLLMLGVKTVSKINRQIEENQAKKKEDKIDLVKTLQAVSKLALSESEHYRQAILFSSEANVVRNAISLFVKSGKFAHLQIICAHPISINTTRLKAVDLLTIFSLTPQQRLETDIKRQIAAMMLDLETFAKAKNKSNLTNEIKDYTLNHYLTLFSKVDSYKSEYSDFNLCKKSCEFIYAAYPYFDALLSENKEEESFIPANYAPLNNEFIKNIVIQSLQIEFAKHHKEKQKTETKLGKQLSQSLSVITGHSTPIHTQMRTNSQPQLFQVNGNQ